MRAMGGVMKGNMVWIALKSLMFLDEIRALISSRALKQ
jgi:hypothetical protein